MEVFDDVPADEVGASVIKTRIGECKSAHQPSDRYLAKFECRLGDPFSGPPKIVNSY